VRSHHGKSIALIVGAVLRIGLCSGFHVSASADRANQQ
jgi:hypothetical protein